jgi:hypothetical protein
MWARGSRKSKKLAKRRTAAAAAAFSASSVGGGGQSANNGVDNDSDGSMLDLREHLKPIGSYIRDRERMLDEMFRCIKGSKLQAMLPDILKVPLITDIPRFSVVLVCVVALVVRFVFYSFTFRLQIEEIEQAKHFYRYISRFMHI